MDFIKTITHVFIENAKENFKEALDKGNSVSSIFMDLSKAFDTLNYDFLIAIKKRLRFFC